MTIILFVLQNIYQNLRLDLSLFAFIFQHGISSLLEYPRVLVLENGKLVEDGDPRELAKNEHGAFAKLLNNTSDTSDDSGSTKGNKNTDNNNEKVAGDRKRRLRRV